ncbi:MAG: hypothetical protein IPL61_26655 [Myxococcales bacterium]|nr:hypothetical protein [Myxococcales bacterium]
MKRRPRAPTPPAVTWRDGVHVLGTSIWCDARRARAVCFVSAADRTARAGHGQLIATATTLALLGARADAHLAAPLHRTFSLGTTRLTLLPSGYAPGAAALVVDTGSHRVLYAGAVDPRRADLAPCDTLVVAAPYGERHHEFAADAEARAVALCQQIAADGAVAVVLVTNALRGLAVAERLAAAGLVVAAHRAIVDGATRLASAGLAAPAVRRSVARASVLVWLVRDRTRVAAALGARPARIVLASGLACEREQVRALAVDAAVPWSGAADRAGLLRFIDQSGAAAVVVTGACAATIAAAVGPRARVLGPPQQMALFAS